MSHRGGPDHGSVTSSWFRASAARCWRDGGAHQPARRTGADRFLRARGV